TFAFFFILPALYVTFRVLMSRNWRAILNLLLAGIILTAIAAIWYVPHIREVIAIYKINNEAAIAEHEAPLFSFKSNIFYIHALISHQLQLPLATLFLAGLIYSIIRFRRESMLLYFWIISGIGVFSMLPNKDLRYTVPVYPAVALLSVCWVGDLRFHWRKRFSLALKVVPLVGIVIWAFLSFFNAQFPAQGEGFFLDTPDFRCIVFARNYFGYDHRPWNNDWGVPDAVQAIEKDWNENLSQEDRQASESSRRVCPSKATEQGAKETHTKPLVGVVVNLPFLNPSNIN